MGARCTAVRQGLLGPRSCMSRLSRSSKRESSLESRSSSFFQRLLNSFMSFRRDLHLGDFAAQDWAIAIAPEISPSAKRETACSHGGLGGGGGGNGPSLLTENS